MGTIEREITISAPTDAVWVVVSDPGRAPEWMSDVRERRPADTTRPLGPGSRWKEKGVIRRKAYETEYEVTAWEPPARLAYQQTSTIKGGHQWVESLELKPAGADATRVTARLEYRMPPGIAGRLYDALFFRRDFGRTLENRLQGLKELLAAPAGGGV